MTFDDETTQKMKERHKKGKKTRVKAKVVMKDEGGIEDEEGEPSEEKKKQDEEKKKEEEESSETDEEEKRREQAEKSYVDIKDFLKLQIPRSVMKDGIIFIWVEKEYISPVIKHLETQDFSYVENVCYVMLNQDMAQSVRDY